MNDQQQFRLKKINEIKDYFDAELKKEKLMGKRRIKFIASFDYFANSLFYLSQLVAYLFATVIGTPVGIVSACFRIAFSIFTGIRKKLLKTTRHKKEKQ